MTPEIFLFLHNIMLIIYLLFHLNFPYETKNCSYCNGKECWHLCHCGVHVLMTWIDHQKPLSQFKLLLCVFCSNVHIVSTSVQGNV